RRTPRPRAASGRPGARPGPADHDRRGGPRPRRRGPPRRAARRPGEAPPARKSPSGPPPGSSLSARRRTRELARTVGGPTVDVLVVGLGATGAGVALDAAEIGRASCREREEIRPVAVSPRHTDTCARRE